ncbi:peptidase family C50-domain-containing protein [Lasiosphaeria hispida]|uniref:separase n=1 Tax=Lasiosphaeria hispida TaxID=260671 RepID=A0AAJ0HLR7_9PEZI|nr:peptidase family C50-domain-containing protein [Lasiosphaeria hispida]
MDTLLAQSDAVCSAVASVSTCTPAMSALLKSLLLPNDDASAAKARPRANTAATRTVSGEKKELSLREKATLATQVINALLKALGDTAKSPPPAPPASPTRRPTQDTELVKTATRNALRRSFSAPVTPLQPRSTNGLPTSPIALKNARSPPKPTISPNLLSAAECGRVALAALRQVYSSGKMTVPPLQLETGMSALISRFIGLGLHEQAVRELRILKKRLENPLNSEPAKVTKISSADSKNAMPAVADLLDFGEARFSGQTQLLIIATQVQVLRVLAATNKPSSIEAAIPHLRHERTSSPINLILALAQEQSVDEGKFTRQMEQVAYYIMALAPSISSKDDILGQEARLSISPASALELQGLGLEARLHWWRFAKHEGNVEKDIVFPLSRYIATYVRRTRDPKGRSVYSTCSNTFSQINQQLQQHGLHAGGPKSSLLVIYQTLATLARESGQLIDAVSWATKLREITDSKTESVAKICSQAAQLLSLHIKSPARYLESDQLLNEVVSGIQGPLRGDATELDELLTNVCLARRAAMSLLLTLGKGSESEAFTPSPALRTLLETLVLQCPRFCLRWLGKPPGPTSSTKDYLRYEQRRKLMQETIYHTLDSAFMTIKTGLDQSRLTWELMDSILTDCATLLEYMGNMVTPDSGNSYFVKMSHFYYMQFYALRQQITDQKDPASMRALRNSIECVKNRPSVEREKAQLLLKLEKMAEVCRALGRADQALGALQTIRSNLAEEGVLMGVARALSTESIGAAWTRDEKAETLSRTLSSIAKLEQVWMDWTVDLPEAEQAAALEHRLHFILLRGGKKENITLQHPTVDSILRTYIPTRFPIRRLRVLLDILCSEVGNPDRSELMAVARDAAQLDEHGQLGEDSGLANFVPHMKAFYHSLTSLSESCQNTVTLQQALSVWQSIVKRCQNKMAVERSIDDVPGLLDHLQSVADFLRMKGHASMLATVLELAADIARTMEGPSAEDMLHHNSSLALQYTNIGQSLKAEQIFLKTQEYVGTNRALGDSVANFHLSFADHLVAIGNFKKAEEHLIQAQAAFSSDGTVRPRGQRKHLVSYASYLHSLVALEKGDSHHALIYSRESVRSLYQDWVKLESQLAPKPSPDASTATEATLNMSTTEVMGKAGGLSPGPEFWRLFYILYRNILRLSSIYAHLGMFQETVYYAEQAQKIAKSVDSELYSAQCAAWMGSMFAKAANPKKSLEMLQEAGALLPDDERSYFSAVLACQISSMYLNLKNVEGADIMLVKAEAYLEGIAPAVGASTQVSDIAALEEKVANLKIEEKPVRVTRRTVRQAAVKKPTKPTAAKAKAAAPPKPVAVVEDAQLSKLRASIMVQKAVSMLGRREWAAALAVLGQATEASKSPELFPTEQVAMAACLMGMSMEQMSRDPVFSVIQDSTISFPAISSPHDKTAVDRHSPGKASPPKKARAAATSSSRELSKEPARIYVENLRQAQQYLLQAHAVATLSSDAGLVHRISGMLQNIGLLLTATSAKARAITQTGHTSYSVELARNLIWRRERKALVLEKNKPSFNDKEWPPALNSATPRRSSLGFTLDLCRFQKDFIDIIPKPWSVISLSLSENNHDLCITKLQAGHSPFVIRLPLERASSRDADNEVFNFQQGRAELLDIIKSANETCHDKRDMTVKGAKSAWWADREALDNRLKDLLENIEHIWLGGFRGVFSQHVRRPELLARFQKSFLNILDKHLPSRRQVRGKKTKAAQAPKVTLDSRVLELFIGLGDATAQDCDFDDELTDLLYFVIDILQFHGETNAYDEIDFDSMAVETFDALHSYHSAAKSNETTGAGIHTILMLDKSLHVFPWESLPCLQGSAVSRMPSLACLRRLIHEQRAASVSPATPSNNQPDDAPHSSPEGHHASFRSGSYILNPGADLKTTETTFVQPLATHLPSRSWKQIVGRAPTETEFEQALSETDILLYFGHGSGAQYIRGRTVRRLDRCRATVLLMGCSSAHLTDAGEFEVYGPAWNYMMAGCPAVVGTLWDVTDRDIDRFAGRVFEEWGLTPVGAFEEKEKSMMKKVAAENRVKGQDNSGKVSLVEAVAKARDVCRFRYVTAAAVAVYGIPVYVEK